MERRTLIIGSVTTLAAFLTRSAWAAGAKWTVKGDYIDSCSCDPTCPCIFGSPPTKRMCQGATYLGIEKGSYGDVNLDGVKILVVYHGGRWLEVIVDNATKKQTDAAAKLLPDLSAFFATPKDIVVKNAKITVEMRENIKIASDGIYMEIQPMKNAAGEIIRLQNLPADGFDGPKFYDHAQYTSLKLKHTSKDKDKRFKYSGTNGFTAKIDSTSDTK